MSHYVGSIKTTYENIRNKYHINVKESEMGSVKVGDIRYYINISDSSRMVVGENLSLDSSGDNIIFPQKIIKKVLDNGLIFSFSVNSVKTKNKVFKIENNDLRKARKETDFKKEDGLVYFPLTYIKELDIKTDSVISKYEDKFAHLHLHTMYSALDGMGTAEEFIERAKAYGHSAMSVNDHGNMSGIPALFEASQKKGIRPIAGIEAYIVDDHKSREKEDRNNYGHINLLAKNRMGFKNLMKLTSLSYKYGFYYRPRMDYEMLREYSNGIICSSACARGPVAHPIYYEKGQDVKIWFKNYKLACEKAKLLYNIYGSDFYFEFMFNGFAPQHFLNTIQYNIWRKMRRNGNDIGCIITNDVHYVCVGDDDLHNRIVNISAPNLNFNSTDFYYRTFSQIIKSAKEYHFKLEDDEVFSRILTKFKPFDMKTLMRGLRGVYEIWHDKCEDYDIFDPHHHLPSYSYKEDPLYKKVVGKKSISNNEAFLKYIVNRNLRIYLAKHYDLDSKIYKDRLKKELNIICPTFVDYMLIVYDIMVFARGANIMCGPGRGSVPGSLVAMMLNITTIDPVKHNLLFERFLNATRLSEERQAMADSLPDIDLDFQASRRDEIKQYLIQKYGEENVANIGTVSKLQVKSGLKDMFRVESVRIEKLINDIKKKIDEGIQTVKDEEKLSKLEHVYKTIAHWNITPVIKSIDNDTKVPTEARYEDERLDEIINVIEDYYQEYHDLEISWTQSYVDRLMGLTRGFGVHAAGIVVAPKKIKGSKEIHTLVDFVPIKIDKKSKDEIIIATQWEDDYIDKVGLLKLDLLGIKQLDIFYNCIEMVKKRYNKFSYNIYDLPLNDKKVYKTLSKGETAGVFQMNTFGPTDFLKKLKPTEFEDLIATISLLRPGPMAAGAHHDYIKLKHGHKEPVYDHKVLKQVLKNTYGLIVYQEQVMQGLVVAGGLTLSESDQFRTIMKKKEKTKEYYIFEKKFISYATKTLKMSKNKAKELWEKFGAFSGYGFNRSHATVYAYIGYASQFLKLHYPEEWWAACLNSAGDEEKISQSFEEARYGGIKFLLPNVQYSGPNFKIIDTKKGIRIAMPLSSIKGIGPKAAEAVEEHQPFKNINDFKERVPGRSANKKVKSLLAGFGSFSKKRFGNNREVFEELLKVEKSRGRGVNKITEITLGEIPDDYRGLTISDRKRMQNTMMSINYHDFTKDFFNKHPKLRDKVVSIHDYSRLDDYESSAVVGNIFSMRERDSKNGKMCIVSIKRDNETVDITMFAEYYNYYKKLKNDLGTNFKDFLKEGNFIYADGPKGSWNGRVQMKLGKKGDGVVIPLM